MYPVPPQAPSTLGVEFSGLVEAFGEGAEEGKEGFAVGDEVFGLAYGGAYAEFIVVSTKMLMRKPGELSWEEAAGVPEVGDLSFFKFLRHHFLSFFASGEYKGYFRCAVNAILFCTKVVGYHGTRTLMKYLCRPG